MKSRRLLTKAVLVVSLLFGVVTFAGTTAEAQFRRVIVHPRVFVYPRTFYPRSYWGYPYGYNSVYFATSNRVTEGQGYRDGLEDGRHDAKHNNGYNPSKHGDYKNGQTSAYLDAYVRGYAEGFNQRIG